MKLQDAIIKVLQSQEDKFLSVEELADLVNEQYPSLGAEGKVTTAERILIRARAYPQFFKIVDDKIGLQEAGERSTASREINRLCFDLLNAFRHYNLSHTYFNIIFLVFAKRLFDLNEVSLEKPFYGDEICKKLESITEGETYVLSKDSILALIQRMPYDLLVNVFTRLEKINLGRDVSDQELSSTLYDFVQYLANSSSDKRESLVIKPLYKGLLESFVKKAEGDIGSFLISSLSDFELLLPYRRGRVHGLCLNYDLLAIEEVFVLLGATDLYFETDFKFLAPIKNSLSFFLGPWGDVPSLAEKLKDYFKEQKLKNGIEWKAIRWQLDHTEEGGTVVALLPVSKLLNSAAEADRRYVLDNYSIKLIAQLPEDFIERSALQLALVVIRKEKSDSKTLPMAKLSKKEYPAQEKSVLHYLHDGKESSLVEYIPFHEVAENKWDLSPGRYLHEKNLELQKFLKTTPASQLKAIKEVITDYKLGRTETPPRLAEINSFTSRESSRPVILIKDFNQKEDEVYLKLEELNRCAGMQSKYKVILDKPAVLYPLHGSSNKPIIFDGAGEIYLGRGIIALIPNELVSNEYLYYQLTTVFTRTQLEKYQGGGVFTLLKQQDFLNAIINIGSGREEQERIITEHLSFQKEAKEKKEKVRNEEFTIINALRHSLKQQLGAINNDISILYKFMEKKEASEEKISLHEPISKRSKTNNRTLQDIFNRINGNYATIQDSLVNMEKITIIDKSALNLTTVNLKDFIKEEFDKLNVQDDGRIKLVLEGDEVQVDIDQSLFCEVVRNLVLNSRKHGFTDQPDAVNYVGFEVKKVKSEGFVEIEYWDSGKGFPEGFSLDDYVRYGTGSGNTKGTGLGGFILDRVIALHDGKLDLQTYEESILKWVSEEEFKVEKNMQLMSTDGKLRSLKVTQIKGASPSMTEAYYALIMRLPI